MSERKSCWCRIGFHDWIPSKRANIFFFTGWEDIEKCKRCGKETKSLDEASRPKRAKR